MLNQLSQWKKGGEGCVCWDTRSLTCQHVATLQLTAVKRKTAFVDRVMMAWIWHVWINVMVFVHGTSSSQGWRKRIVFYTVVYRLNLIHEFTSFFSTKVIFAGMPTKTSPRKQAFVDRKQGPRSYCQMKELDRTTEPIARMNVVRGGEGWACRVQRANMWQHCSLSAVPRQTAPIADSILVSAVQRKTVFVEQSWWPEFDMFGSMPWCSFPWHKLLPRLTQNNCFLYSLPSKFDPWVYTLFSKKVIFAGMPKKTFPRKQAFVDREQGPRFSQGQPEGYCQMKELDRTAEAFARMNAVWKVEKAERAEFNVPTCGNIAVCQQCRDRQRL